MAVELKAYITDVDGKNPKALKGIVKTLEASLIQALSKDGVIEAQLSAQTGSGIPSEAELQAILQGDEAILSVRGVLVEAAHTNRAKLLISYYFPRPTTE